MNKKQLAVVVAAVLTALQDMSGSGAIPQQWTHLILLATTILSAVLPALRQVPPARTAKRGMGRLEQGE